MVMKYKRAI